MVISLLEGGSFEFAVAKGCYRHLRLGVCRLGVAKRRLRGASSTKKKAHAETCCL